MITTRIAHIYRSDKDKEGNLMIAKSGFNKGKPFTKISIKVEHTDYPDMYLNGFGSWITDKWEVGDEVHIEVTPRVYNDKTYHDFKPAKPIDPLVKAEFKKIEARLDKLENKPSTGGVPPVDYTSDVKPEDLPF